MVSQPTILAVESTERGSVSTDNGRKTLTACNQVINATSSPRWHLLNGGGANQRSEWAPEVARSTPPPPPMSSAEVAHTGTALTCPTKVSSSFALIASAALLCCVLLPLVACAQQQQTDNTNTAQQLFGASNDNGSQRANAMRQLVEQVLFEQLQRNAAVAAAAAGSARPQSKEAWPPVTSNEPEAERRRRVAGSMVRPQLLLPMVGGTVAPVGPSGHLLNASSAFSHSFDTLSSLLGDDGFGGGSTTNTMARHYMPKTISTARGFGKRSGGEQTLPSGNSLASSNALGIVRYGPWIRVDSLPTDALSTVGNSNNNFDQHRWQRKWIQSSDLSDLLSERRSSFY